MSSLRRVLGPLYKRVHPDMLGPMVSDKVKNHNGESVQVLNAFVQLSELNVFANRKSISTPESRRLFPLSFYLTGTDDEAQAKRVQHRIEVPVYFPLQPGPPSQKATNLAMQGQWRTFTIRQLTEVLNQADLPSDQLQNWALVVADAVAELAGNTVRPVDPTPDMARSPRRRRSKQEELDHMVDMMTEGAIEGYRTRKVAQFLRSCDGDKDVLADQVHRARGHVVALMLSENCAQVEGVTQEQVERVATILQKVLWSRFEELELDEPSLWARTVFMFYPPGNQARIDKHGEGVRCISVPVDMTEEQVERLMDVFQHSLPTSTSQGLL